MVLISVFPINWTNQGICEKFWDIYIEPRPPWKSFGKFSSQNYQFLSRCWNGKLAMRILMPTHSGVDVQRHTDHGSGVLEIIKFRINLNVQCRRLVPANESNSSERIPFNIGIVLGHDTPPCLCRISRRIKDATYEYELWRESLLSIHKISSHTRFSIWMTAAACFLGKYSNNGQKPAEAVPGMELL